MGNRSVSTIYKSASIGRVQNKKFIASIRAPKTTPIHKTKSPFSRRKMRTLQQMNLMLIIFWSMIRFLSKIPPFTIFLLLILFTLSSNKDIIDHFLKSDKSEIVLTIEKGLGDEKDNSDKSEKDKKEKSDYYSIEFIFNFFKLNKKKPKSALQENAALFVVTPLSPPPEHTFA